MKYGSYAHIKPLISNVCKIFTQFYFNRILEFFAYFSKFPIWELNVVYFSRDFFSKNEYFEKKMKVKEISMFSKYLKFGDLQKIMKFLRSSRICVFKTSDKRNFIRFFKHYL